ncbi:MAG TPA: hypothetical protein PLX02_12165 [Syntrophorhabdaceae bacterium]|nr:hypothetical protein [Syntrophorhabdaceae bacterium]HQM82367.1 hypothetical protein [Syntrophorhabdaceae bacterium]
MNIKLKVGTVPWYFLIQYAVCLIVLSVLLAVTVIINRVMTAMEHWED